MVLNENDTNLESVKFIPKKSKDKSTALNLNSQTPTNDENPSRKPRWLFIGLIVLFIVLIILALVVFIYFHPGCTKKLNSRSWWQEEVIYQIEVSNFKDSDGDAIGDINGVIQKLDYVSSLGAMTVCLSRVISKDNLNSFDSAYGDSQSMSKLREELDSRDMHLIIDLPFNYLEHNDEAVFKYWLENYVDGIRVTNLNSNNKIYSDVKIEKLANLVEELSSNGKLKYFGVDSAEKLPGLQSYVSESFLELNPFVLKVPARMNTLLKELYSEEDESVWPILKIGDVNSKRIAGLFSSNKVARLVHGLVLLLKGTPFTLFGDEIELEGKNEIENMMQWSTDSLGCGFTDNEDAGNFFQESTNCLKAEKVDLINMYKNLTKLRQAPAFSNGDIKLLDLHNVIAFTRSADLNIIYLTVVNPTERNVDLDLSEKLDHASGSVAYSFSSNGQNRHYVNDNVDLSLVTLSAGELLVIKVTSNND